MNYYVGKIGYPQYLQVQQKIPNVGLLMQPPGERRPTNPYACDNGVYAQFVKGVEWNVDMHNLWVSMIVNINDKLPPEWVLLPDAVGNWPRTVELAKAYTPFVKLYGYKTAIALQDGCDFDEVLQFNPDWVFVGGTTEWKEQIIHSACEFFHARGIKVHVGRVNTVRRVKLCMSAGVDSVDGTTLNAFRDATLDRIANAIKQPSLLL